MFHCSNWNWNCFRMSHANMLVAGLEIEIDPWQICKRSQLPEIRRRFQIRYSIFETVLSVVHCHKLFSPQRWHNYIHIVLPSLINSIDATLFGNNTALTFPPAEITQLSGFPSCHKAARVRRGNFMRLGSRWECARKELVTRVVFWPES